MNYLNMKRDNWLPAPEHPALAEGEVHLWRIWLSGTKESVARLRERLDAAELAQADRFIFPEHRRRHIIARMALRGILARYAVRDPEQLTFITAPGGKPFLDESSGGGHVRFNMTHSGDLMLLAVTARREVGVDVEQVRDRADRDRLAQRYFAPEEAAQLRALPEAERREEFFRCWTRKEAYIKAIGKGLALPLRSFCVPVHPGDAPMRITTADAPDGIPRWTLHDLDPADRFVGALVVDGPVAALRYHRWEVGDGNSA